MVSAGHSLESSLLAAVGTLGPGPGQLHCNTAPESTLLAPHQLYTNTLQDWEVQAAYLAYLKR